MTLLGTSSLDLRLTDSETFTPFLLDATVTISDSLPKENVFNLDLTEIIFPGIPFAGAGVSLDADVGLDETFSGERIYFSNPGSSLESENDSLSFTGSSTVLTYYENADAQVVIGFWPGLFAEAFGYKFPFNPIRIPFSIFTSELPLEFNQCNVNFSASDIQITNLSLLPSTCDPYDSVRVNGEASYNTGNPLINGTINIKYSWGGSWRVWTASRFKR